MEPSTKTYRPGVLRRAPALALALSVACGASSSGSSPGTGADDAEAPADATRPNDLDAEAGATPPTTDDAASSNDAPAIGEGGALDAGPDVRDADVDGRSSAPASDVVGKVTVGYQGWFAAVGDGSPANRWWHYDSNTQKPPSQSDVFIKAWPDMTDFTTTFQTGFANLGNGMPATLFSSYTPQTVDAHVRWMQENDIDTAALQRFNDETPTRNAVAINLMKASEKYDRKFYVMYDISGWTAFESALPLDWTDVIVGQLKLTASTAYAKQNGKPVVSVWGCGFADRPGTVSSCTNVINALKAKGLYVIGGVPRGWHVGNDGSLANFGPVYDLFDMISPWMIGALGNVGDSDAYRKSNNEPDIAYCKSHHIDYQPCVLPGDLSVKQRTHGDFMWHQFANMIQIGAQGIYVSMYDEFNEGNQIAKTAATAASLPTGSTFVALDEDGTACSSDYYLRLTGDGGKMLKGQIPLTFTRPTSPM
jgi:hypothetical protein